MNLIAGRRGRSDHFGSSELNERLDRIDGIDSRRREATTPCVQALDINMVLASNLGERAAGGCDGIEDTVCVGGRPTRLTKDEGDRRGQ